LTEGTYDIGNNGEKQKDLETHEGGGDHFNDGRSTLDHHIEEKSSSSSDHADGYTLLARENASTAELRSDGEGLRDEGEVVGGAVGVDKGGAVQGDMKDKSLQMFARTLTDFEILARVSKLS